MTVSAQTPINRSTGNGVTTVFPYTFKIISDGDIEVSVDDVVKTLNVDYTVSGAGVDAGGNVTMTVAPANATSVVRRRNMALVRSTDYQDQGELPATTLDNDIDATVLMVQQLDERLDRTFSLPASFSGDSTLPDPEPGYLIGWDATGDNLTNIPASVGSSLVDLAAPSGSSLVGYLPAGTGAVSTTVQAKLRESVSVKDFGADPAASAATNYAAFVAAEAAAAAAGLGLTIPAGNYTLDQNWVISHGGLRVRAEGKVVLSFTNAGNGVSVDGGASGLYIFDVHFGTPDNPIWINGNASTTTALFWRAAHHGSASVKAWNCVIGHRTQFAVCNNFWITVSNSEAVSNVLVPTTGISCERRAAGEDTADNTWWAPVIEGVLTSSGHGIYLGYTNRNKFWGGTSEGNVIGVYAASTAVGDCVNGLYCEVNTGAAHFDISGSLITLTDCFGSTGAPTPTTAYARFRTGATDCRVLGGNIPGITIDAGAVRTQVIGNAHSTGTIVTDNGTGTLIIQGQAASKLTYGSKFGSGTTYVLDFYDAGTITATMICGTSGTITLNATYNKLGWVKIGRLVTVTGLLIVDSVSSPVGVVSIGTLTYATDSDPSSRAAAAIRVDQLTAGATTQIMGKISASSTTIQLESYAAGATDYSIADYIKAGSEIQISLSYIAVS